MSASKDDKQAQANDNLAKPINAKVENKDRLSILVVSGRSGSGKTSVLNILEDLGYYSIDNLPLSLVPEALDPPKGCCPTTAPVGLSLM